MENGIIFAMEAPELEREAALAKEKGLKVHLSTPEGLTFYEHLGEKGVRGINFTAPAGRFWSSAGMRPLLIMKNPDLPAGLIWH